MVKTTPQYDDFAQMNYLTGTYNPLPPKNFFEKLCSMIKDMEMPDDIDISAIEKGLEDEDL